VQAVVANIEKVFDLPGRSHYIKKVNRR
jgi:hypothetical protein